MNDGSNNRQWRGGVLALTLLMVFSMTADPFFPSTAEAKPKRDRGVDAQVIGGQPVPQGRFTFMTLVLIEIEDELFQCGGSLIDPTHILTAAHCTDDFDNNPLEPSAFEIFVGKANLNDLGSENERGVAEVFQHPDWDPGPLQQDLENDVAVLRLDEAVPSSIANPIPFADSGQTGLDEPGKEAVVAGWGLTSVEPPSSPDQLQEATLELASGSTCSAIFGSQFQSDIMLCASFPSRDSCFGDSGGPLIVKEKVGTKKKKRKHGKHHKRKKRKPIFASVQTGIVSFGSNECDTAGAYTRITAPGINDFIVDAVNS